RSELHALRGRHHPANCPRGPRRQPKQLHDLGPAPTAGRDGELSVYGTEAYYTGPGSRVRRFAYRVDGFVALRTGSDGGEAVTRPVRFQGKTLVLNAKTAERGRIAVELQDAEGNPIDGFRASNCRPMRGDFTARAAAWSAGSDLSALAGKTVRLRFIGDEADLFSFRFE